MAHALARSRVFIDAAALGVAAAMLAAFTIAMIYVVGSRYLMGHTPDWAEELPRTLLVWSVFVGLIPATLRGSHLSAGLAIFGSGPSAALAVRWLVSLFLMVLGYSGWQLTLAGADDLTTALQIPYAATYAAVPFGCVLAALANLLPRAGA